MKNKVVIGCILTVLGGCFWGLSGACGQFLFQTRNVTSDWLVSVRMLIAGIILVIISAVRNKKEVLAVWKGKRNIIDIIVFAVMGMSLCQYSYFTSISYSNAATATVLCYLGPIFIVLYVAVRKKKLPRPLEIISVAVATIGTIILATHFDFTSLAMSGKALFWGLVSAVSTCIYVLQPQRLLKNIDSMTVVGWSMVIGGSILTVIFKPWNIVGNWDIYAVIAMSAIIIFGTLLSFCFFFEGTKIVGPVKASVLASSEPIMSAILSIVWLKVEFSWIDIIGMLFIVFTIFIMGMDSIKHKGLD